VSAVYNADFIPDGDPCMACSVLRRAWLIGLVAWLVSTGSLTPQAPVAEPTPVKLPGESTTTARRLVEARKRVEQRQWADAVDEYQRILEEAGDDLVALDPQKPQLCVQARRLCQSALAALPPEALKLYRRRADELAKKWLDQGSSARDPAPLRHLVDQAFCSRHAEKAIDLLGELALERGAFEEAEQWWRLLARPASEKPEPAGAALALIFPDLQMDVAQVRAKQILARILGGERTGALAELKAFRAAHPKAEGYLAGRQGNYADLLDKAVEAVSGVVVAESPGWPTFAGAPARTCLVPKAPRCRWLEPTWRVGLDGSAPGMDGGNGPPLTASQAARACAFFPVIAGNLVLVADARAVTAYDLDSGRRVGRCDLIDDLKNVGLDLDTKLSVKQDVRYTLTVAGDRVFARLGSPAVARPREGKGDVPRPIRQSALVCLALPPTKDGKLTAHWQARARAREGEMAFFEGAPLVRGDSLFVARTRFTADGRAITAIDCYLAATGAFRWECEVCESREAWEAAPRHRHHLLTLAGTNLVHCSHSGVVATLDATTGKRLWAARYRRRGMKTADGEPSPRDLAPCVFADGRVYAAPADAERIFCFDAATGTLIWESAPREVVHLLGVAAKRLIFTTATKPRGIRALDTATGADLRDWIQPEDGGDDLPSLGRGLLAGNLVFWPTSHGLRLLSQEDGKVLQDAYLPKNSVMGNLATGSGCLIAATDRELIGYVPEARLLEQRRKDAMAQPRDRQAQFRLASALAAAGHLEQAVAQFRQAETLAGNDQGLQRVQGEHHAALLSLAEQHSRSAEWTKAADTLSLAAAPSFISELRLQALERQATLAEHLRQPEKAVAVWQSVLADTAVRRGCLHGTDQLPRPAAAVAARNIERLLRDHGQALYARYETAAKELLNASRKDKANACALSVRLIQEFPNSAATRELCWHKGDWPEQMSRAALQRWRLALPASETDRAITLAGLAQHYEKARHWEAAAATWQRLARDHGDQTVDAIDGTRPLRVVVSAELRKPEYLKPRPSTVPDIGLPLSRIWQSPATSERLLPMGGQALPSEPLAVFFVRGQQILVRRNALTGEETQACALEGPLTWGGQQADLVMAAGPHRIHGLQAVRGTELVRLWEFPADGADEALHSFQLSASRLFFMQGGRLWALDVETGQVLWQRSGSLDPRYLPGPEVVVVRTLGGQRWVLSAQTGRTLYQNGDHNMPWPKPPLALDHLSCCIVGDARHVTLFEPMSGRNLWKHPVERVPSLTGEPPRLLGSGDILLMLVTRNYGEELVRLDTARGSARWTRFLGSGTPPLDMAGAAIDSKALYAATGNVLRAFALADGELLWQTPLGSRPAHWRIAVTRGGLLVYPTAALLEIDGAALYRRYLAANSNALLPGTGFVPVGAALPGVLAAIQSERCASQIPVLAIDPADGRLLQRLNFASVGSRADAMVFERSLLVVGGNAAWGLR
jgi:outer membrane protein assembly factor BamB/tetratricopeptide (TPR) repeat protein